MGWGDRNGGDRQRERERERGRDRRAGGFGFDSLLRQTQKPLHSQGTFKLR